MKIRLGDPVDNSVTAQRISIKLCRMRDFDDSMLYSKFERNPFNGSETGMVKLKAKKCLKIFCNGSRSNFARIYA